MAHKEYSTNEALRKLFLAESCSQLEFAHRTETDKNSVHDWLKSKNQIKFNKLEEIAQKLGKELVITIK